MIRDPEAWREFEDELCRRTLPDLERNLRIFEELHRHATALGILPLRDPLEGIETDVHLARALHARLPAGPDREDP